MARAALRRCSPLLGDGVACGEAVEVSMRLPVLVLRTVTLVLLLAARLAYAIPVTYNEGVSGDLGETFPATVFTLDVGSNTVSGTTSFGFNGVAFDFDQFAFVVPVGMHVTDITYAFATTTAGPIPFASI